MSQSKAAKVARIGRPTPSPTPSAIFPLLAIPEDETGEAEAEAEADCTAGAVGVNEAVAVLRVSVEAIVVGGIVGALDIVDADTGFVILK